MADACGERREYRASRSRACSEITGGTPVPLWGLFGGLVGALRAQGEL
jgi:hypothetical protein